MSSRQNPKHDESRNCMYYHHFRKIDYAGDFPVDCQNDICVARRFTTCIPERGLPPPNHTGCPEFRRPGIGWSSCGFRSRLPKKWATWPGQHFLTLSHQRRVFGKIRPHRLFEPATTLGAWAISDTQTCDDAPFSENSSGPTSGKHGISVKPSWKRPENEPTQPGCQNVEPSPFSHHGRLT